MYDVDVNTINLFFQKSQHVTLMHIDNKYYVPVTVLVNRKCVKIKVHSKIRYLITSTDKFELTTYSI